MISNFLAGYRCLKVGPSARHTLLSAVPPPTIVHRYKKCFAPQQSTQNCAFNTYDISLYNLYLRKSFPLERTLNIKMIYISELRSSSEWIDMCVVKMKIMVKRVSYDISIR